MRIQHNISALNANNQLSLNDNAISKNLQKLSSGYRINSAADDAAGLAISEKMRSQINGLDQAESNANDGISLVQTAEGALSETTSILQRMNTLATESANGTYQDGTDRDNLQDEIDQLTSEINTISTSTNFNKINLLDGSLSGGTSTESVATFSDMPTGAVTTVTEATTEAQTITAGAITTATTDDVTADYTVTYKDADGNTQAVAFSITDAAKTNTAAMTAGDVATSIASALSNTSLANLFDISVDDAKVNITAKTAGADKGSILSLSQSTGTAATLTTSVTAADAFQTINGTKFSTSTANDNTSFEVNGQKFVYVSSTAAATTLASNVAYVVVSTTNGSIDSTAATNMAALITQKTGLTTKTAKSDGSISGTAADNTSINVYGTVTKTSSDGLVFQVGADNDESQQVSLTIGNMSASSLGISNISVKTQKDAQQAISTIQTAVNSVSAQRATLGAVQNRLEHTVNNLSTTSENLTSAESSIRDVDMSSEMVSLTKNEILEQAATSMLSQANSLPQNVLTLLQ